MAKNIKIWKGKTGKIFETLIEWSNLGVKYYILYHGHFYGFNNKVDAENYVPQSYPGHDLTNTVKEWKRDGWAVKQIPNSFDEFSKIHFGLMEAKLNEMENRLSKISFSKTKMYSFYDSDNELIFSACADYSSINEGDLITLIPEDEENEITYRIITIIKKLTCNYHVDDEEIEFKIIVQPYVEGKRKVLVEKNEFRN